MSRRSRVSAQSRLSRKAASVTLEGPPATAGLLCIGDLPCQPKHLISRAGLPNRLKSSVVTTSPMVDASAVTGSLAMSAILRDDPCSCAYMARGAGPRAAGKWTDAATGEHGDLLDVIRDSSALLEFRDVLDEARRFLSLPRPDREPERRSTFMPAPVGSPESARRLFAMSKPIHGTIAETYLRTRGISGFARDQRASAFIPAATISRNTICRRRPGPP